ncbi:hypothetical protein EBO34_14890 [Alteribacter keqinensis]|uniref:Uncharacterized protein n=1 Tax=Alteribacter keqinensis TaxID=2483800 RepID=A0A3M7TQX4_9BACI|nr:hypothetical protein EBO34_14890 [Alteribacter keqinensis]
MRHDYHSVMFTFFHCKGMDILCPRSFHLLIDSLSSFRLNYRCKEVTNVNQIDEGKQHHRMREWKKAIACYETYIKESKGTAPDQVFQLLARALRFNGHPKRSLTVIQQGLNQFPESETLLVELHQHYDFTAEWKKAKSVAKKLVKSDPGKPDYLFRMGRTYSFLDDYSKARQTYKKALERKHLTSFSSLIEKIEDSFPDSSSSYTSHYRYVDGINNFGAIFHENAHHRYFTKISSLTGKKNGAAREESFYMEVCSDFPELKALVPGFVNTRHLDGLSYLTIEMINATPSDKKHAQQAVRASHKLTRVSYNDIKQLEHRIEVLEEERRYMKTFG